MSTRGRKVSTRGRKVRLERQIRTIRQELKDLNTGRFSKRNFCIRLPPWENYAKVPWTCRLQHNSNENSSTVILGQVFSAIRPQFGWYNIISATVYGPTIQQLTPTFTSMSPFVDGEDQETRCCPKGRDIISECIRIHLP